MSLPPQPFVPIRTAANVIVVLLAVVPLAVVSPVCVYSPALGVSALLLAVFSIPWAYLALMVAFAFAVAFRERVAEGRAEETPASPAVAATARVIWFLAMLQAWLGELSFAPEIDLRAAPLFGGWTLLLVAGAFISATYYASPRRIAIGSALAAASTVLATVLLSSAYGAPWLYAPGLGLTILPVSLAAAGVEASRQGAETNVD